MTVVEAMSLALALLAICVAASAGAGQPETLDSGLKPEDVEKRPYLEYARECIERLMAHGTDRYGAVHSPILMNILDVRADECPQDPLPLDEAWRVIRRGRRGPAGANLYADQPTLRAFLALADATGDPKYADFARRCIAWYLEHLVDDKGLFWWGWHRHYDAHRDQMTGHGGSPHEIHIQQCIWPILWDVNREAVAREIEAIWKWHVIDKATGEVNRHADGQRGCDFAMSGGEILLAFAFLHSKTGRQEWLDRARLVADYYWRARHPGTGLVPNRPNAGASRFDGAHFDTSVAGFLCSRLLQASEWTKEPAFRDQAVTYLKAYGKHGYDAAAKQFWGSLKLDGAPVREARVVGGYGQYEPRGHIDLWQPYAAGYEHALPAAQAYAYAYGLTRDAELLETARRWADCVQRGFPPRACLDRTWYAGYAKAWAPHGAYAEHYGRVLSFALQLHALTGEARYLDFAKQVARQAVSRLWYRGWLRGHPAKPYYESIDGVGFLLNALIQLDRVLAGKPREPRSLANW